MSARVSIFVLSGLMFALSLQGADFTVPSSVKQKYGYLYSEKVLPTPDGGRVFHRGRLFLRKGVRVLSLAGDRFEMAFQHGRLLKDVIPLGAVPQSSRMLDNSVRNGFPSIPLVTGLVVRSLYKRITEGMFDFALAEGVIDGDQVLLDAYGLAEGSGVSAQTIVYGALGPETLQVLLGERVDNPAAAHYANHCTAFALWGKRTGDGNVLVGRNTDYPLNGSYDQYPTVLYFTPDEGQRFMAVGSAGVHNGGVVGVNESGLYLGVHSVPTGDVSPNGIPAFFLAQEILREAKTLADAERLFRLGHTPSGWAYMVVSFREKKALTVELSNHHTGFLPSTGDYHVQTNHWRTAENLPRYLHVNPSLDRDTEGRFRRVDELIRGSPVVTPERAMEILGDKEDPFSHQVRGLGNTVSVHTTMTSVVVEPGRHRVWVASGRAPVSVGEYVEFPLVDAFAPADFLKQNVSVVKSDAFAVGHPRLAQAEQGFIAAKIAYENDRDYMKAHRIMEEVLREDGANPAYRFVGAILALKAGDRKAAKASLKALLSLDDLHLANLGRYLLARLIADERDKGAARRSFEALLTQLGPGEEKLRAATVGAIASCRKLLPFSLNTATLGLMMQQADLLGY